MNAGATAYADPLVISATLAGARDGESFVYATGPALDPGHPTALVVSAALKAGTATANIQGRDIHGRLRYAVVKLGGDIARAEGAVAILPVAVSARLSAGERGLLDLLDRAAVAGLACPSLRSLATALGLRNRSQAQYALRRLRRLGLIEIENPHRHARVVRIVSSGARTRPSRAPTLSSIQQEPK